MRRNGLRSTWIALLFVVLFAAGGCAGRAPQPSPSPTPELTATVAERVDQESAAGDGYPAPAEAGAEAYPPPAETMEESYPLPQPTVEPAAQGDVYPPPDPTPAPPPGVTPGPTFAIDEPIRAGATQVTGSGPANVPIRLVSVTELGVELGRTTITDAGTFTFELADPLPAGHSVGLQLGDLSGTPFQPDQFQFNPTYYDRPYVGILFDIAPVTE